MNRHCGCQHCGSVVAVDQIDFIDVEQLGVDAGDIGGIALIIVEDALHRPPQQPTPRIDILLPDALRKQNGLSVSRQTAGHRHAVADLDRRS
jgi:hypothetical protein